MALGTIKRTTLDENLARTIAAIERRGERVYAGDRYQLVEPPKTDYLKKDAAASVEKAVVSARYVDTSAPSYDPNACRLQDYVSVCLNPSKTKGNFLDAVRYMRN